MPKTIDNDLDLPAHVDTFGYQTARHVGRRDPQEPDDRRAHHLALVLRHHHGAQGRAPGARDRQGGGRHAHPDSRGVPRPDPAQDHRRHAGRCDHQAALRRPARRRGGDRRGRGAGDRSARPGRDRHDQPRRARQPEPRPRSTWARSSRTRSSDRDRRRYRDRPRVTDKEIGYELRCADPIPFDMEYTRDLGLLRRPVPARRRPRGDGLDAGRALRADPVRQAHRSRHRALRGCAWWTCTRSATRSPAAT